MSKASEAHAMSRYEEILDACAELYEVMAYKDITILKLAQHTSFTRTSIYNYFASKEEIFLALLQREYLAWTEDLNALAERPKDRAGFAERFSALLEKRKCMLKLLSMNLFDMEAGSRFEALVEFKRAYGASMDAVRRCLMVHTGADEEEAEGFVFALYPFLLGAYPYAEATEKQIRAMDEAGARYPRMSVGELVKALVEKLVESLELRV